MPATGPAPSAAHAAAPSAGVGKSRVRWSSRAPNRPPLATLCATTLVSAAGLVGLVVLGKLSNHLLLIPPMAASMALIAAAPHLPLSQPRSVIGGQFVSALIGTGVGLISHSMWAAAIAGGLAIGVTMLRRMPHSPAAATAVIGTMATTGQLTFLASTGVAACLLVGFGLFRSRLLGPAYPSYWI